MVYYATPVLESEFDDLIALIVWPTDCNAQPGAIETILAVISALKRGFQALAPVRLHVASDTPPGLADWQTAWIKLGYELPISGNVVGIWETITLEEKDTAQFVWLEGEMRPTLARWPNGSSEFFLTTPSMYTNTTTIGTSYATQISHPLTLKRPAYIYADYAQASISGSTDFIQWQSTLDGASDVRGAMPLESFTPMFSPRYFRFTYPTKISSSTLSYRFKRSAGASLVTLRFTNTAQSRKIESGYLSNALLEPTNIGEISALSTEAIYLA